MCDNNKKFATRASYDLQTIGFKELASRLCRAIGVFIMLYIVHATEIVHII